MAGHSKWANIKHRKEAQDARRGKAFTKHIREITVAARGGSDIDSNSRLRIAVNKALDANMTRDTIARAIKRGSGDLHGVNYEEVQYEGYATAGIAVLVKCLTDNKNRTVAAVRHAFNKHNGNLGTHGSVAYLFKQLGVITLSGDSDEEQVLELALQAGADDVNTDADGNLEINCQPQVWQQVLQTLKDAGITVQSAAIVQRADNTIPTDETEADKVLKLVDTLQQLDDVQEVFTNMDFSTCAH